MTEQQLTIKNVESLTSEVKVDIETLKLGEHLKTFIEGMVDEEDKQKQILRIAIEDLKQVDMSSVKDNCKQCYGRGFTGFNNKTGHFSLCIKCFK
jgi:hypothetical protein